LWTLGRNWGCMVWLEIEKFFMKVGIISNEYLLLRSHIFIWRWNNLSTIKNIHPLKDMKKDIDFQWREWVWLKITRFIR
jgi:hypothetical protein